MILNVILIVIGLVSLFFGVKNKLKLFTVVGLILLCAGLISGFVDYRTGGLNGMLSHRVPFTIDNMVK